jgi:hypothetical protein
MRFSKELLLDIYAENGKSREKFTPEVNMNSLIRVPIYVHKPLPNEMKLLEY